MLLKIVEGIQEIKKDGKTFYILHTVTVDNIVRDGFVGKQCENIFVSNAHFLTDVKVGSKIRVYYDNVGGKAYLCGIEICK